MCCVGVSVCFTGDFGSYDERQGDLLGEVLAVRHVGQLPLLQQAHLLPLLPQRRPLLRKERRRTPGAPGEGGTTFTNSTPKNMIVRKTLCFFSNISFMTLSNILNSDNNLFLMLPTRLPL